MSAPPLYDYSEFTSRIARFVLRLFGWKTAGDLPNLPKYVIIGALHTSNWDFVLFLLFGMAYRKKFVWTVKDDWYHFPFRTAMDWLGAFPINREQRTDVVKCVVEEFEKRSRFVFLITPEGTRKYADYWKSGFYHISRGAHVPIALSYVDYARKLGGVGHVFMPMGDIEADMDVLREFYADITPKFPHEAGPVRLKTEVMSNEL